MNLRTTFFVIAASVTFATVLPLIQGSPTTISIVLDFLVYLVAFGSIGLIYLRLREYLELGAAMDEMVKSLNLVSYYRASNIPAAKSVKKAALLSTNRKISLMLREASARIGFGETLFESVLSSVSSNQGLYDGLKGCLKANETDLTEALLLYEYRKRSNQSRANALASRYATCGMFISTVAPSFVIFSFIGGLLISQKSSSILFLSIALTAVIPVIYSIINSLSMRSQIG